MCFDFKMPLPTSGKPFIYSFHLCPRWASRLFFHFALAHAGQACFLSISYLPMVGRFVFMFILYFIFA